MLPGVNLRLRAGVGVDQILPTPAPTLTPAKTIDSDRLQIRSQLRLRSPHASIQYYQKDEFLKRGGDQEIGINRYSLNIHQGSANKPINEQAKGRVSTSHLGSIKDTSVMWLKILLTCVYLYFFMLSLCVAGWDSTARLMQSVPFPIGVFTGHPDYASQRWVALFEWFAAAIFCAIIFASFLEVFYPLKTSIFNPHWRESQVLKNSEICLSHQLSASEWCLWLTSPNKHLGDAKCSKIYHVSFWLVLCCPNDILTTAENNQMPVLGSMLSVVTKGPPENIRIVTA